MKIDVMKNDLCILRVMKGTRLKHHFRKDKQKVSTNKTRDFVLQNLILDQFFFILDEKIQIEFYSTNYYVYY